MKKGFKRMINMHVWIHLEEYKNKKITLSSWLAVFSSLILISRISLGSWSTPRFCCLATEGTLDVLATVSCDVEAILCSRLEVLLSTKFDSLRLLPDSWSTFALLELESPPWRENKIFSRKLNTWKQKSKVYKQSHKNRSAFYVAIFRY